MKNTEEQIVNHQMEAALDMEATASSQLQSSHLRDADDSTSKKFIAPYFDKHDCEHLRWATCLPHWHQDDKYVFVTFRLADSLPQAKLGVLQYG